MVVAVAFVVMDVEQPQIRGHFVNQRVELAREVGMAGVEASADTIALEAGEDPQEVGRLSEHEVRKFVFQHALDPDFAATRGHAFEDGADVFDAQHALLARGDVAILGSGMDDEVVHSETGCGFDGAEDFRQGVFAAPGFQR